MTNLLIPGLETIFKALTRHRKLYLNDSNLSLSLESAARVINTKRGPVQLGADHTTYRYTLTMTLHEDQMQTLIKILNTSPVNGETSD